MSPATTAVHWGDIMRLRPLLTLPVLAATVLAGPSAAAAPPPELRGSLQLLDLMPTGGSSPGQGGKVNLFTAVSTSDLDGDLDGETVNTLRCVLVVGRSFSCHGTSEFMGTVEGAPATGTGRISFHCHLLKNACTGRTVPIEGTGALAGVRGITKFDQNATTGAGTYRSRLVRR